MLNLKLFQKRTHSREASFYARQNKQSAQKNEKSFSNRNLRAAYLNIYETEEVHQHL